MPDLMTGLSQRIPSSVEGTPAPKGVSFSQTPAKLARLSAQRRRQLAGLLFTLPSIVFVSVFFLLPLVMTGWMSLFDWPLMGEASFVGLNNYIALLSDAGFWGPLLFTLKYTVIVTIAIFAAAFPFALLVEKPFRGVSVLRTAFFTPVVVGLAAASFLWAWLINSDIGLFSVLAQKLGFADGPVVFIDDADNALVMVIGMIVWKAAGFTMIILLTGLQNVPSDLHEAAMIDGAGPVRRFLSITLPLMRKTFALALILCVTGSMLAFDQFYIITGGGPQQRTITMVHQIYTVAFKEFRLGYASALSIVLLLILLAFTLVQLRLFRSSDEH